MAGGATSTRRRPLRVRKVSVPAMAAGPDLGQCGLRHHGEVEAQFRRAVAAVVVGRLGPPPVP